MDHPRQGNVFDCATFKPGKKEDEIGIKTSKHNDRQAEINKNKQPTSIQQKKRQTRGENREEYNEKGSKPQQNLPA